MSEFGGFSGFKVNNEKSSIMFLNDRERRHLVIPHPFINAVDGFNYLGIKITPKIGDISSTNYEPLLASVSKDITRWMALPLSLMGRISVIKMTILPKFLYLFQSIPLPPPPTLSKNQKAVFEFYLE